MPRVCTICDHPERGAIDHMLVGGAPNRRIAAQFAVTEQAIRRHKSGHLPTALVKAEEAQEVARGDNLLGQMRALQSKTLTILDQAERAGDGRLALTAISQARANLELLARLLHEISDQPVVNILVAPEWLVVRAALLEALAPYPDARVAVAARLLEIEAGNGHRG